MSVLTIIGIAIYAFLSGVFLVYVMFDIHKDDDISLNCLVGIFAATAFGPIILLFVALDWICKNPVVIKKSK